MNTTARKLLAAVAITLSLGAAAPAFAGYWYNPCAPYNYCPVYNPTLVCGPFSCSYR